MIANSLEKYYRTHAVIYDATRWSFLFGRHRILRDLAIHCPNPARILEVGCGTGKNLKILAKHYPEAAITGLDMSEDMLKIARKKLASVGERIRWRRQIYDTPISEGQPFDLILFSYSLSMFNPGWENAIASALDDLGKKGCIAVVDFESTPISLFRKWMVINHVRMDGHLLPYLIEHCKPLHLFVAPAYAGCWRYFLFLGQKRT